tara:strand:- start:83299 stop:83535 length:237 start_codon:yes stop_codon:yes gene_type:complete
MEPYQLAQHAIADLKTAILLTLRNGPEIGMKNADLGRCLGIHHGHAGHEGHIQRSMLALMESEGLVVQDNTSKLWRTK